MLTRRFRTPLSYLPLLLLSLLPPESAGQPISVLPGLGYEYGAALSITRSPGIINQFQSEGFGTSYNHTFWVGPDLLFQDIAGTGIDGLARIRAGFASGRFTSDPYRSVQFISADSTSSIITSNQFQARTTQTLAGADLMLAWSPLAGLRLLGGGWGSYRLASASYAVERIMAPEGTGFPQTGGSERMIQGGAAMEADRFRFGLVAGLGVELRFSRALALHPSVVTRCDLDAARRDLGLRAFSFDASISVGFDLGSSGGRELPDSVVVIAGKSDIRATVDLFNAEPSAGDSGRAVIRMRHTDYSQFVPLPPFIFFERYSDSVPARYLLLNSFSGDMAPEHQSPARTPYEAYYNVLNILGRRMRDDAEALVTLAGTAGPQEPPLLGLQRAGSVRRYLGAIWGIDSSRVRLALDSGDGCTPGPLEGMLYVRIIPSPPTLLAPTFSAWVMRDHTLPNIGLTRKIRSALGVRSWELSIHQGSRLISRFTEENEFDPENDAAIPLSELVLDATIRPLIAMLEVTDPTGTSAVATDELRIELADTATPIQREIRSYMLLEPTPGCPEVMTINKALVSSISGSARPTSRIFVSSPRPSSKGNWGASSVAAEILTALNAAEMVPAELRVANEPLGDTTRKLLPEEMIFSRAVRVTLEQQGE